MTKEGGSWAEYQKLVLKLLEQHDEKLEELSLKLINADSDHALHRETIESLKKDTSFLLGLVRDGLSGSESIIQRINALEKELANLKRMEQKVERDTLDARAYKRALSISILGICASVIWDIVSKLIN